MTCRNTFAIVTLLCCCSLASAQFAPPDEVEWTEHGKHWLKVQPYAGILSFHLETQDAAPEWELAVWGYHSIFSSVQVLANGQHFAHVYGNYQVASLRDRAIDLYKRDGTNVSMPTHYFVSRIDFTPSEWSGGPNARWLGETAINEAGHLHLTTTWDDVVVIDAQAMIEAIEQHISILKPGTGNAEQQLSAPTEVQATPANPDQLATPGQTGPIDVSELIAYGNDINHYAGHPSATDGSFALTPPIIGCAGAGFVPGTHQVPYQISFAYRHVGPENDGELNLILGADRSVYEGTNLPLGDAGGYIPESGGLRVRFSEHGLISMSQGDQVLKTNYNAYNVKSEGNWVTAVVTVTITGIHVRVGNRTYIKWQGATDTLNGHIGFTASTTDMTREEISAGMFLTYQGFPQTSHQIKDITITKLEAPEPPGVDNDF